MPPLHRQFGAGANCALARDWHDGKMSSTKVPRSGRLDIRGDVHMTEHMTEEVQMTGASEPTVPEPARNVVCARKCICTGFIKIRM